MPERPLEDLSGSPGRPITVVISSASICSIVAATIWPGAVRAKANAARSSWSIPTIASSNSTVTVHEVVGEIEFYPITDYLTGCELSYLIFGPDHGGKGYATEAVGLLTAYLFARLRIDCVQLNIHPDNEASRRVGEKAGYTLEGLMRRCWFHNGEFHDLEIWSMLRSELPTP